MDDFRLINLELMKNPLNWITIVVMLVIFFLFLEVLTQLWHVSGAQMGSIKPPGI